jgi:peptidoglycan hydrolase-like protein with peptidoglycan-binding domain
MTRRKVVVPIVNLALGTLLAWQAWGLAQTPEIAPSQVSPRVSVRANTKSAAFPLRKAAPTLTEVLAKSSLYASRFEAWATPVKIAAPVTRDFTVEPVSVQMPAYSWDGIRVAGVVSFKRPESKGVIPIKGVEKVQALPKPSVAKAVNRTVNRKSREYVRWVQGSLSQVLQTRLSVDGIMGRRTRKAIRKFQKQSGMKVDGIVGSRTEAALLSGGAGPPPGREMVADAKPTGDVTPAAKPTPTLAATTVRRSPGGVMKVGGWLGRGPLVGATYPANGTITPNSHSPPRANSNSGRYAIIEYKATNEQELVREGDSLKDGPRIVKIDQSQVVFEIGGQLKTIGVSLEPFPNVRPMKFPRAVARGYRNSPP